MPGHNPDIKFPRIYKNKQGETQIGIHDFPQHEASLGPPPNPVGQMTERDAVSSFVTFSAPAGTEVLAHNAPQSYICIVLSGEGEVEANDGTTVRQLLETPEGRLRMAEARIKLVGAVFEIATGPVGLLA
jgi:quercetin dioxygenase-like cupin family protein